MCLSSNKLAIFFDLNRCFLSIFFFFKFRYSGEIQFNSPCEKFLPLSPDHRSIKIRPLVHENCNTETSTTIPDATITPSATTRHLGERKNPRSPVSASVLLKSITTSVLNHRHNATLRGILPNSKSNVQERTGNKPNNFRHKIPRDLM